MDEAVFSSRRSGGPEVDFGVQWYERDRLPRKPWVPSWRVSWIEDTGELYAVELAPGSNRRILLGVYPTREAVEEALDGWSERPIELGPLCNLARAIEIEKEVTR